MRKNDYYDMTANINVTDYDGSKYYMWDAKKNYWNGHEWNSANPWQPVLAKKSNPNYPVSGSSYFHMTEGFGREDAMNSSFKDLPNANEVAWYAEKGDARWDGERIWTTMGHLYKGGMWFKNKAFIKLTESYSDSFGPGIYGDMRDNGGTINKKPAQGAPVVFAERYFFLPALGFYANGFFDKIGEKGFYWSSSADPTNSSWAYSIEFDKNNVKAAPNSSSYGIYVGNFDKNF